MVKTVNTPPGYLLLSPFYVITKVFTFVLFCTFYTFSLEFLRDPYRYMRTRKCDRHDSCVFKYQKSPYAMNALR